jgi:hypothetical protein
MSVLFDSFQDIVKLIIIITIWSRYKEGFYGGKNIHFGFLGLGAV